MPNYKEIEYIEFTGTQYINTNIIPSNHKTITEFDFDTKENEVLFGTSAGGRYYHFTSYNSTYYWGLNGTEVSAGTWSAGRHTLEYNGNNTYDYSVTLDNTRLGYGNAITSSSALLIGKREGDIALRAKVYYFQVYDKSTNTLVLDLIPVKDENNVVCMYDKVSKTYFRNAGTGNFIAGPEKSQGKYETRIENNNTDLVQMQSDLETMQAKVNNLPKAAQPIYGSSIFTELDILNTPGTNPSFIQDTDNAVYYIQERVVYKYDKSTQTINELFTINSSFSQNFSYFFALIDNGTEQCLLAIDNGDREYYFGVFSNGTIYRNRGETLSENNYYYTTTLKMDGNIAYILRRANGYDRSIYTRTMTVNFLDHTVSYDQFSFSGFSSTNRECFKCTPNLIMASGNSNNYGQVWEYTIDTSNGFVAIANKIFQQNFGKANVNVVFVNAFNNKVLIVYSSDNSYSGLYNITDGALGSQIKTLTELGLTGISQGSFSPAGDNLIYINDKMYSFDETTNTFTQLYANVSLGFDAYHSPYPGSKFILKKSDYTKLIEPTPNTNAQIGFVYGGTRYSLSRDYGVQNNRVVAGTNNVRDGYGDIVTGTMIDHGDLNIIPDTNGNTYNAGFYNSINVSAVNASIDANITANNIANGVDILGVIGTLDAGGGTNTMDANALANDIVQGKTAYVNGVKITGTVFEAVPGSFPMYGEATMFDMNYQHNAIVTSGYLPSGDGILMRGGVELGSIIYNNDMANALNLQPDQIANGVSIFGVNGELTPSGGYVNQSQLNTICNTIATLNVPNMGVGFQDESGFTIRLQGFVNTSNSSNTQLFNAPSWLDAYEMYDTNILDISVDLVGNHADLFNVQTDASHFALYAPNPTLLNNIPDSRFWLLGIANFSLLKEGYQNYIETTVAIDIGLMN